MIGAGVGSLNVLYIDDDDLNLKVVSAMLDSVGATITCCRSPHAGLNLLAIQAFDVVLIDIHMPEMSGIDLLRKLRTRPSRNRGIPALALTADMTRDELQYRKLGFDGFIAKPVVMKKLLGAMLAALAANAKPPPIARRRRGSAGTGPHRAPLAACG